MKIWAERGDKRVRAAAEHEGVSFFGDVSLREAVHLLGVLSALSGIRRAQKRYERKLDRRYKRYDASFKKKRF